MMVGLSIILESQKETMTNTQTPSLQVINKATVKSSSSPKFDLLLSPRNYPHFQTPTFLDRCFLCNVKLLPGNDIYMYKGDKAFCSEECRFKQILMDDEESNVRNSNCFSLASMKPTSSSSSSDSRHRKQTEKRTGGFAY